VRIYRKRRENKCQLLPLLLRRRRDGTDLLSFLDLPQGDDFHPLSIPISTSTTPGEDHYGIWPAGVVEESDGRGDRDADGSEGRGGEGEGIGSELGETKDKIE
jgi:hypothetical protein